MKFINELREGEKISGIYLCKHKQPAVTKNGKPYENVKRILIFQTTGSFLSPFCYTETDP